MSSAYSEMQMKTKESAAHGTPCAYVPEFKRLKYFYGQMLGAYDFQTEQDYFREKLKLHNRCLHGYGVVCGLKVVPEPVEVPCGVGPKSERGMMEEKLDALRAEIKKAQDRGDEQSAKALNAEVERIYECLKKLPPDRYPQEIPTGVRIECGLALDCEGNELVVRQPLSIDLWRWLSPKDRERLNTEGQTIYISLCYCEQPVDPVRPVLPDACGASPECINAKLQDAVRIVVTLDRPAADLRCETCCEPCGDPCLLLARIDRFQRGEELDADQIRNEVRRTISLYPFTTITAISWVHGAEYTHDESATLLGTDGCSDGLKVRFSRPVLVSTLTRGVVDLWVIQGGRTRRGDIYNLEGEFVGLSGKTTEEFRYRYTGDETLDPEDRVLITIRTPFILDECCRPLDGAHVGGRVPALAEPEFQTLNYDKLEPFDDCPVPPPGYGPWRSGTGFPGSSFESWFYIKSTPKPAGKAYRTKE